MREIIKIDESKCTGCAKCIPNCPEGALQIIDGKARLVSDLFCDGLGACVGHCPEGAMTIIEREAERYDEKKVMQNIVRHGEGTIRAHLKHLKDHGAIAYHDEAVAYLNENGITLQEDHAHTCPGAHTMDFHEDYPDIPEDSQLRQWPVQLMLINPSAPYFSQADLIIAADCTAYALSDFHSRMLKGKSLVIACPKLDSEKQLYIDKIHGLIDEAGINTLTVATMEVPCCQGLLEMTKSALKNSQRKVPIKSVVISIRGKILTDNWV